jgi:alanine dehydrogenase
MIIGIPKEVKNQEYRVGTTPSMVKAFVDCGHRVIIQKDAGARVGFTNEIYMQFGAEIVDTIAEVYSAAEMIIKVKEPQESEFELMHEGQIIFTYLHLAPDPVQTEQLLKKRVVGIAYETVTDKSGKLPLLQPMSEIAGRVSVQAGAWAMHMGEGGHGVLLGGVPGVAPANVVVIGGGVSGTEAARMAMGLGADVTILDRNIQRLRELDTAFGPRLKTIYSSSLSLEEACLSADLVIGAVLLPGGKAPKLVSKELINRMKEGALLVDISIDQGGCAETSRPTTHSEPTYLVDGVVHYCVTNMPSAFSRTATMALTNATMDFALQIANKGYQKALLENSHLKQGLNVCAGEVTNEAVANSLGLNYCPPEQFLR